SRDLSSDNGGAGHDYRRTFLDDTAINPVAMGTAPFNARYRPEQTLDVAGFRGQLAGGAWRLIVGDDTAGNTGTLTSWTPIMCQQLRVPRCGNANADPGEQCDDGNNIPTDACNNSCVHP